MRRVFRGALWVLLLGTACATTGPGPDLPAPVGAFWALSLPLSSGGTIRLADLRGKVLLVDFFTTWAQTSLPAISHYRALYGKYHPAGLEILGIALDDLGAKVVEPFRKGFEVPYPIAIATEAIRDGSSPFGPIDVIPTLLVFDRKGNLVRVQVGYLPPGVLEKAITDLL